MKARKNCPERNELKSYFLMQIAGTLSGEAKLDALSTKVVRRSIDKAFNKPQDNSPHLK